MLTVDKGLKIIVDNAGEGYGSLRHVLQLNPEVIKLDKSLVSRIDKKKVNHSLATAIITFARNTDIEIIAEGVESENEMNQLKKLGINYMQGHHFSEPLRKDRLSDLY